jgi:AraC-like DNA-binding protein
VVGIVMNVDFPSLLAPHASLRCYVAAQSVHSHAHAQILLGVRGGLELELNGHLAWVDATSGLLVPAGCAHAFAAPHGAQVWVIDAPDGPGLNRPRAFALPPAWSPEGSLEDALALASGGARALPRRRLQEAVLVQAVAGRLHEDWPVARMAQVFALSVAQFHARWRELTGWTPQAWLRQRRLAEARVLLHAGRRVDSTALAVGYASPSALLHALRREGVGGAR